MDRIALVDDDRNILTSLSIMLESDGYEVETYTDGECALKAFGQRAPDIAILDVKMPRLNGMDLLKRIRQTSDLPVVMLSSLEDEADAIMGLRLGADDFVTKPFSPRVLLERLRACRRRAEDPVLREAAIATPPVECGPLLLEAARHAASWRGVAFRLTRIEFQLLEYLAERPGIVRRRQQMLDLVHGHGVHTDDRTIDTHVRRLRTKIRAIEPTADAIQTVHGLGYRFVVPSDA